MSDLSMRSIRRARPQDAAEFNRVMSLMTFARPLRPLVEGTRASHVAIIDRLEEAAQKCAEFGLNPAERQELDTAMATAVWLSKIPQLHTELMQNRFAEALSILLSPTSRRSPSVTRRVQVTLRSLHQQWRAEYQGTSLSAFKEMLAVYQQQWDSNPSEFYSKSVTMVQSSGWGKSRLISEYAKESFTIIYTLRIEGETGYPPGDTEVTSFLRSGPPTMLNAHTRSLALLYGTFDIALEWCSNWRSRNPMSLYEDLVQQWRDDFEPTDMVDVDVDELSKARSNQRIDFCTQVITRAEDIAETMSNDPYWAHLQSDDYEKFHDYSKIRELGSTLQSLVQLLSDIKSSQKSLIVLAFDETGNLFNPDPRYTDQTYTCLRRILRYTSAQPLWSVFLSTQSNINFFTPSQSKDSSGRIQHGHLKRFDPFIGFERDLELSRRLKTREGFEAEIRRPLMQFATSDHITMFGRPLWLAYKDTGYRRLIQMAIFKLLCGEPDFETNNKNHVFAAIACRISLSPCTQSIEAVEFAKESVNSHLRMLVGVNSRLGTIETVTPSEPLIAEAITEVFSSNLALWSESINTLVSELFSRGLIEKGLKGELYFRLVCILARDYALQQEIRTASASVEFPWSRPFTVLDFLKALFRDTYHTVFNELRENRNTRAQMPWKTIQEAFSGSLCNFTHFTTTDQTLQPEKMQDLLHALMMQNAALQLAFNQADYDLLIPVYFGKANEAFDCEMLSAIVVQIKNQVKSTTPILSKKNFTAYFTLEMPVLYILADLGVEGPSLSLCTASDTAQVLGLHAKGHGTDILKCVGLTDGLAKECQRFFAQTASHLTPGQDKICQRNLGFRYHSWEERYPNMYRNLRNSN